MLPSAPVDGAQVVAGAEQVLVQVVLPAGDGGCSECWGTPAPRQHDGQPRQPLPSARQTRNLARLPAAQPLPPGAGDSACPAAQRGGLLSKKDALLEVAVAQGHLLQALKGQAEVEVEPGPHLSQLSPRQRTWKTPLWMLGASSPWGLQLWALCPTLSYASYNGAGVEGSRSTDCVLLPVGF